MANGLRDIVAFWIFGLANNFAYVIMLSAAEDIIHLQEKRIDSKNSTNSSSSQQCIEELGKPRCEQLMSTGAILMADILPALLIKFTFPFFMNRIPFGFRHFLVCSLQTFSYLIVAFSSSIEMSLIGVVFASMSSGLGELCYLALSSHYKKSSIAAWSSGTGGAGLIGSLAYALLTEPKMLFALSPKNALLSMLIVPAFFVIAYWFILTPSATVHKMSLLRPSTWIVPKTAAEKKAAISIISSNSAEYSTQSSTTTETSKTTQSSTSNSNETNKVAPMPSNGNGPSAQSATTHEFPLSYKLKLVLPLLRYMIPLSIVYFAEYLINSGLHQLVHFDCSHGFSFALASQFRWYQTLYQFGVFTSRSSVFLFQLPRFGLFLLPFLQCANLVLFYFQALFAFIPHIFIIFLLIYIEGLYGGASYVNTFHRIHKEARPEVREFSMSIASSGDSLGISLASICSILIHNQICHSYPRIYP